MTNDKSSILKKIIKWVAGVTGAASLVTFLLSISIIIPTFCIPFFEYEYNKNNIYADLNMDKTDLMAVTKHMLSYMRGNADDLNIETTVNGETRLFFSDREILHMKDVKNLYSVCFMFRNVSIILFAAAVIVLLVLKRAKFMFKCFRIAGIAALIALIALTCVAAINFDAAFETFHKLFFNNDLWLLDPDTDLLINILSGSFFNDIAAFIGIIFAASLAVSAAISHIAVRRVK